MTQDSLDRLNERLLRFARERDWEQFQSPKNLAMALAGEAGELLEHFQWLTEAQSQALSPEKKRAVGHELADILNYLVRLAERLDIDLLAATDEKIAINEQRYPAEKVRGDPRRAADYAAVSLVATATAMPLVAYHFQMVNPLAVLLSLLALPVLTAVLTLGYLKVLCGMALPSLALVLSGPLRWVGRVLALLVEEAAGWPGSAVRLGPV